MYTTKISQKVNSEEWNKSLLKSKYSTFFQTAEYLHSNSNERFPLFIEICDQNNDVIPEREMCNKLSNSR